MREAKYIVDIIGSVVSEVNETIPCEYLYGHPLEITNILSSWGKDDTKKFSRFPLICLYQDFEETKGENQMINSLVSLKVVIITNTEKDYNSIERYTNTFKTVLYPLYNLFMDKLAHSGMINNSDPALIPHKKIDRLYWGKFNLYGNTGSMFNDYIDAIELQNLELEILNNFKKC